MVTPSGLSRLFRCQHPGRYAHRSGGHNGPHKQGFRGKNAVRPGKAQQHRGPDAQAKGQDDAAQGHRRGRPGVAQKLPQIGLQSDGKEQDDGSDLGQGIEFIADRDTRNGNAVLDRMDKGDGQAAQGHRPPHRILESPGKKGRPAEKGHSPQYIGANQDAGPQFGQHRGQFEEPGRQFPGHLGRKKDDRQLDQEFDHQVNDAAAAGLEQGKQEARLKDTLKHNKSVAPPSGIIWKSIITHFGKTICHPKTRFIKIVISALSTVLPDSSTVIPAQAGIPPRTTDIPALSTVIPAQAGTRRRLEGKGLVFSIPFGIPAYAGRTVGGWRE